MSLTRNITANILSQGYVSALGIVVLPLYLRILGAEGLALVGIFNIVLAWFALLDLGVSSSAGREMARFRGHAIDALGFRQEFRAFSLIFVGLMLAASVALLLLSPLVAGRWLRPEHMTSEEVQAAFVALVIAAAARSAGSLPRGVVAGAERQTWLGVFSAVVGTIRFLGVVPIMLWLGSTPIVFFAYQIAVGLIESLAIGLYARRLLPDASGIGFSLRPILPQIEVSSLIGVSFLLWFAISQADKLLLSSMLPMSDFGHFTTAATAASAVTMISLQIITALLPTLTRLFAEGQSDVAIASYRNATQIVAVLAGSVAITMVVAATPLLVAWTGDSELAHATAPILALYAAGNLIASFAVLPHQILLQSLGRMRLNVLGHLLTIAILIPSMIVLISARGGVGAGLAWCAVWIVFLLGWVAIEHHVHCPGLHLKWLFRDVLSIVLPASLAAVAAGLALPSGGDRMVSFASVTAIGLVTIAVAAACSSTARGALFSFVKKRR